MSHGLRRTVGAIAIAFVGAVSTASAQTQVRVTKDRATIWHEDAPVVAAQVAIGTVLQVVAREGEWYVVTVPPESGGKGEAGRIAISQVEALPGGPPAPTRRPALRAPAGTSGGQRSRASTSPDVSMFGFGQVAYGAFLAKDTFKAVLGRSGLPAFGGGGQVRVGDVFAEIAVDWYQKSGERVFVNGGEVFKLGISETVRIIPIYATVGYRVGGRNVAGYGGGGVGQYLYRETGDFADDSEGLDHFMSYHALGGVEFSSGSVFRLAVEVQYTTVPNGLGAGGASAAFGERNLGGVQFRVKLLAGR